MCVCVFVGFFRKIHALIEIESAEIICVYKEKSVKGLNPKPPTLNPELHMCIKKKECQRPKPKTLNNICV